MKHSVSAAQTAAGRAAGCIDKPRPVYEGLAKLPNSLLRDDRAEGRCFLDYLCIVRYRDGCVLSVVPQLRLGYPMLAVLAADTLASVSDAGRLRFADAAVSS